jgi:hypothetical protein
MDVARPNAATSQTTRWQTEAQERKLPWAFCLR